MTYLLNQVFVSCVQQKQYTVLCGGPDLWETHFSTVMCLSGKVENREEHKKSKETSRKNTEVVVFSVVCLVSSYLH